MDKARSSHSLIQQKHTEPFLWVNLLVISQLTRSSCSESFLSGGWTGEQLIVVKWELCQRSYRMLKMLRGGARMLESSSRRNKVGGTAHRGTAKENKRLDRFRGDPGRRSQQGKVGKSQQVARNSVPLFLESHGKLQAERVSVRGKCILKAKQPCKSLNF